MGILVVRELLQTMDEEKSPQIAQDEEQLRDDLAAHEEDVEERQEREAWEHTVAQVQWRD